MHAGTKVFLRQKVETEIAVSGSVVGNFFELVSKLDD